MRPRSRCPRKLLKRLNDLSVCRPSKIPGSPGQKRERSISDCKLPSKSKSLQNIGGRTSFGGAEPGLTVSGRDPITVQCPARRDKSERLQPFDDDHGENETVKMPGAKARNSAASTATAPITVELPGEPQGKGRPRFRMRLARFGGSAGKPYTPARSRAYELALRQVAAIAMRGRKPLDGALKVTVAAFMAVPASWPARKRDVALAGATYPTVKPDIDNVVKMTLDAGNGVLWLDDKQIVVLSIFKQYDEVPRLRIEIWSR